MGTKVSSVLKNKGYYVVSVAPHQIVASVVEVLTQKSDRSRAGDQ